MPEEIHVPVDMLARVLQLDPAAIDEMRRLLPAWDRAAVDASADSAPRLRERAAEVPGLLDQLEKADDLIERQADAIRDALVGCRDALGLLPDVGHRPMAPAQIRERLARAVEILEAAE